MFFEKKDNSIVLRVRLTPNSSSCLLNGIFTDAKGQVFLKVNVVAVPEKGKANQELINFLAKLLKIAKSEISIVGGETDRYKKLHLKSSPRVISCLEKWSNEINEVKDDGTNN